MTILDLAKELISIPSIKGNTDALKQTMEIAKKELAGFTIEELESNGIPSLLAYVGEKRPEHFKVILNAHLDVVPAKGNQYQVTEKDGKLHGRGTNDMKAAGAVEILVFKDIAKQLNYPLALQLVADEEIGGFNGTGYQVSQGVKGDFVIAGEPTNFGINNKAKGIIWAKVHTFGKVAHGAYPWNGENALWKIKSFLDKLEKTFPVPEKETWVTTANLAKLETSNNTFNQVPEDATAWIDVRYVPQDTESIEQTLRDMLPEGATIEFLEKEPAQGTSETNPYVLALSKATEKVTGKPSEIIVKHGGSDVRFYEPVGVPGVTFGPIGAGLHSDEEWVDAKSLEDYYNILKEFLLSLA